MSIDDMPSPSDRPPGWEMMDPSVRSTLGALAWETDSMTPTLRRSVQDASLMDLLDTEAEERGDNNE